MDSFGTLAKNKELVNPSTDKTRYTLLHEAIEPHVQSFNALTEGPDGGILDIAIKDIGKKVVFDNREGSPLGNKLTYWIDSLTIGKPAHNNSDKLSLDRRIFPAETRERMSSYKGKMTARVAYKVNDEPVQYVQRELGQLPIMLSTNRCHLEGLSPAELVKVREESEEMGGYFIINGIEKLIRMLIVQRRNHPMAIERSSFQNRGALYSKYGIQIRCVRPDQSSQTNVLHYLTDGQVTLRFSWRKNEYLIPVVLILKALIPTNDRAIFDGIIGSETSNSFLTDRIELMLRNFKKYKADNQTAALRMLGQKFRVVMNAAPDLTDVEVGQYVLDRIVLVHLGKDNQAKANLIYFMIRKLYALVAGECCEDNPDSAQHQEILLPGLLFGVILKEKLEEFLLNFRDVIRMAVQRQQVVNFHDDKWILKMFMRTNEDIGRKMAYFLSTGNLISPSGLDLQQVSGYTVVAEKINFHRFLAHFRMVHRGAFFAELKTTTVRKLLPESWGFMCPVHTPDGSPCGLLNHLAHKCKVVCNEPTAEYEKQVVATLRELGLPDVGPDANGPETACVQLDGKVIGYTTHRQAKIIAETLRFWKVKYQDSNKKVPLSLEVGYVPPSNGGQYPGLYLFTGLARMIRPVKHLALGKEDLVGPFEQVYMNIAVTPEEIDTKVHTHVEFSPTNILSILANMTPFSDFNQSPRNMYQCQMGKQTMGTPGTALACRSDNKLYKLQSGQTPIVRTALYDQYGLDEFPNGTNAVVAVISYTGYDMDDAMILNKSAVERGFGHGVVYKTERVDLDLKRGNDPVTTRFGFGDDIWPHEWRKFVDDDGLPIIGTLVNEGDPIAAYFDELSGRTKVKTYHSSEPAWIQEVRLINDDQGDSELQSIIVKFRLDRTPNIGDKFSSRHGQKGVCSQKWPQIDLPFSESGISPDVIINPHAFPSRMTIGMFVESLAGKAGAMHGIAQDCTPWSFSEDQTAADYFGDQLKAAGFNFHGNEPMYSGVTGEELRVDIYVGVVFYQRLRHMVNDKFQVRSTGGVNRQTMQPVKGRKRGGGIRVGEMERDAFLGHGTAYLLQDRLLNCSDYSQGYLCRDCGSLITVQSSVPRVGTKSQMVCRRCAVKVVGRRAEDQNIWDDGNGNHFSGGTNIATVTIPFVLRYLDSELAAMGVRLRFNSEPK